MSKSYLAEDELSRSIYLMQPSRPVLVTTCNPDGSINVAPFSWMVPVSMNPPMVMLALLTLPEKQHSLVNIEREGTFVVNLPGMELAERMVRASYRCAEGVNKFEQGGFSAEPSREAAPPGVGECRAHIECRAEHMLPAGDHTMVIASVVAASYDPNLYDENLLLRLDYTTPCIHMRQRKDPEGQTHFFLKPAGVVEVFVPYPEAAGSHSFVEREQAAASCETDTLSASHPSSRRCDVTGAVDLG